MTAHRFRWMVLVASLFLTTTALAQDEFRGTILPGGPGGKGKPCPKWQQVVVDLWKRTNDASPATGRDRHKYTLANVPLDFGKNNPAKEPGLAELFDDNGALKPDVLSGYIFAPKDPAQATAPRDANLTPYENACATCPMGVFVPGTDPAKKWDGRLAVGGLNDGYFIYLDGNATEGDDGKHRFTGDVTIYDRNTDKEFKAPVNGAEITIDDQPILDPSSQKPVLPPVDDQGRGANMDYLKGHQANMNPTGVPRKFWLESKKPPTLADFDLKGDPGALFDPIGNLKPVEGTIQYTMNGENPVPPGKVLITSPFVSQYGVIEGQAGSTIEKLHAATLMDKYFAELQGDVSKHPTDENKRLFEGKLRIDDLVNGTSKTVDLKGELGFEPPATPTKKVTVQSVPPASSDAWDKLLKDLVARQAGLNVPADGKELPFSVEGDPSLLFERVDTGKGDDDSRDLRELEKIAGAGFQGVIRSQSKDALVLPGIAKLLSPFESKYGVIEPCTGCGGTTFQFETAAKTATYYAALSGTITQNIYTQEYDFDGWLWVRFLGTGHTYRTRVKGPFVAGEPLSGTTTLKKIATSKAATGSTAPVAAAKAATVKAGSRGCGVMGAGDGLWMLLFSATFWVRRKRRS